MEGISFVIFSSNNARTIGRSIKSIIQTMPPGFKQFSITVFDKASSDGTAGVLKKLCSEYDNISVVYDKTDGLAVQQVFHDNMAGYILVTDASAFFEKGCISELISALDEDENILLTGAKVRLYNHTLSNAGRINENIIGFDETKAFIRHLYHHLPESLPLSQIPFEPEIISTLCYAIRSNDFNLLFPANTSLRDLTLGELCFRIRHKRGRIRYVPGAVMTRLHDNASPGFMFAINPADLPKFKLIPGFEEMPSRINEDIRVALAQNLVSEVFSSKKSGFKGNFILEKATGSVFNDHIHINKSGGQARIYFPRMNYEEQTNLIIMAELEVNDRTSMLLKYATKTDPVYSDKKSYLAHLYTGKQFRVFAMPAGHMTGELCFEFPAETGNVSVRNIEIYKYADLPREKSLISIVIPCYNHGEFLDEALESLKRTSKEKYEVIIVNDGSNDPQTLEKFRELESKGYFVVHQENKGLGAARNEGIRLARGNYILPLDSDNRIRPVYIERGIEILDMHPGIGVVYGDVQRFGDSDDLVEIPEFDPVLQMMQNTIDACAMFRKEVWEEICGYEENMVGYQDWAFWMAIAATENWGFFHIDDIVFDYRIRKGSMVSNTKRYHSELRNYILTRNISFVGKAFQKLYTKHEAVKLSMTARKVTGHETVMGSLRIHWRNFIDARFKRKITPE